MKKLLPILIIAFSLGGVMYHSYGATTQTLTEQLKNKSYQEKAAIKSKAIAKIKMDGLYVKNGIYIEIVGPVEEIVAGGQTGVQFYARAWKNGKALGLGDGSIETEHFRIFNPPILVDDPNGTIVRTWTDKDGTHELRLREDPAEAIKEILYANIVSTGKENTKIIPGSIGHTTDTFFPAAGANSPVDGHVYRETSAAGVEIFTTIIAGNGTAADALSAVLSGPELQTAGVGYDGKFRDLMRGLWGFNTSTLGTDTITSATISFVVNLNARDGGDFDVVIVPTSPASASNLATTDYQNAYTRTSYGSKTLSTFTDDNTTYNDITLNAAGIAYINKSGNTFFGGMSSYDFNQSYTPAWAANKESRMRHRTADEAGTSKDPKLTVVHNAVATTPVTPAYFDILE